RLSATPIRTALGFRRVKGRVWAPAASVLALGAAFILLYDYRVTGRPTQLPQAEYQRQYDYAPLFNILPLDPLKTYRHESFFNLTHTWEFQHWAQSRSWRLLVDRPADWYLALSTITGGAVSGLALLAAFPSILRDERVRLPCASA